MQQTTMYYRKTLNMNNTVIIAPISIVFPLRIDLITYRVTSLELNTLTSLLMQNKMQLESLGWNSFFFLMKKQGYLGIFV